MSRSNGLVTPFEFFYESFKQFWYPFRIFYEPFEQFCYPFGTFYEPFEWFCYPFRIFYEPFERFCYPFGMFHEPFERLGYPFGILITRSNAWWNPFQTAWWPVCNPFDSRSFYPFNGKPLVHVFAWKVTNYVLSSVNELFVHIILLRPCSFKVLCN